jgi:aspartate ammonia-lyase
VATEALESGASVYETVIARGLLTRQQLDELLDPATMTAPQR